MRLGIAARVALLVIANISIAGVSAFRSPGEGAKARSMKQSAEGAVLNSISALGGA